jgi:hypothetical protein
MIIFLNVISDIYEQFAKQQVRKGQYSSIYKNKNANMARLIKDAMKEKFAGYVEERIAQAEISNASVVLFNK